jgi:DNA adenine methylase
MSNNNFIIKPFLKWVGGKTQIIYDILSSFPSTINNYYEPFLGGGSVLLAVLSYVKIGNIKIEGNIYASDLNPYLVGLYINIQKNCNIFINELQKIIDEFNKCNNTCINRKPNNINDALTSRESYYFWIRNSFNQLSFNDKISPYGSAMFLFLNKTGFRGMYREGPNGLNVPYGNYINPSIFDEEHIKSISILIKDVIFITCPFTDALNNIMTNDFIYLDPPYAPENDKSFVSYTYTGFNLDDNNKLFDVCKKINEKKIKFVMSNSNVKLVTDQFNSSSFNIKVITCRRSINSKNPQSTTQEVLISN